MSMKAPPSPRSASSSTASSPIGKATEKAATQPERKRERRPKAAHAAGRFLCTTCSRPFATVQALGGHQNAHRKSKDTGGSVARSRSQVRSRPNAPPATPPVHGDMHGNRPPHTGENTAVMNYPWESTLPRQEQESVEAGVQVNSGELDLNLHL